MAKWFQLHIAGKMSSCPSATISQFIISFLIDIKKIHMSIFGCRISQVGENKNAAWTGFKNYVIDVAEVSQAMLTVLVYLPSPLWIQTVENIS